MTDLPQMNDRFNDLGDPGEDALALGRRAAPILGFLREVVEIVVFALIIFFVVRSMVVNFRVEGASMEPSLHENQLLLVSKLSFFRLDLGETPLIGGLTDAVIEIGRPSRGDIVVLTPPNNPERDFIKRIVAIPGDRLEVRQGQLILNGEAIVEPYAANGASYSVPELVVPKGQFYVLGDNRRNSSDSHVWGPVSRESLLGKAWLVYWPVRDWGTAPNFAPVAAAAP